MGIFYYILSPFAWLLKFFYNFSGSYGVALILFAVVVKLILFPFTIQGKRSMIQMNQLSGKMQQLQKQYGKDRERYNIEVQRLYEREKANPMGGCLWSFLPILMLWPLYSIIRQPLHHLMGLTGDQIATVADTLNWTSVALERGWINQAADKFVNNGFNQMYLASLITNDTLSTVRSVLGDAADKVFAINFNFLGLDLTMLPTWRLWEHPTWPYIGAFLLILISAGSGLIFSRISMRTNKMNNQSNEQMDRTNRTMMLMMPLMSLWIGFIMPTGLCLYWVAQNLLSMVQELIAGRLLKKDYEAARLAAEERERQEKEEEKKRKEEARLERARRLEEEKQNKKKKSAQSKKNQSAEPGIDKNASKVGIRAYARGRSYDPNRFGGVTSYRDPNGTVSAPAPGKGTQGDLFLPEEEVPEQENAVETAVTQSPVEAPVETVEVEVEAEPVEVEVNKEEDT